jgi:hypothetical protein
MAAVLADPASSHDVHLAALESAASLAFASATTKVGGGGEGEHRDRARAPPSSREEEKNDS